MSSKPLMVHLISWRLLIQSMLVLILMVGAGLLIIAPPIARFFPSAKRPVVVIVIAGVLCLAISHGMRFFILPKLHRGVKLFKKMKYEEALWLFLETSEFYQQHPTLDRLRWFLRLDYSAMTYREISLVNIAGCQFQLGHAEQARLAYEQVLAEYPENPIALNAMKAIKLYGEKQE